MGLSPIGLGENSARDGSGDPGVPGPRWQSVESHDWGTRLRRRPTSTVSLVIGPPAAPKVRRNRLRPEVGHPDREPGEFLDAGGNEFHVTR
ncbi:hypothetical protein ACIRS1_27695 [Kitasatospora sp. NPDC101176]|uniref:hypothetical protein n=1 Tax=Kitasatospora sp. NPDC101176 TaxID=3364099 RepID=UPI003819A425